MRKRVALALVWLLATVTLDAHPGLNTSLALGWLLLLATIGQRFRFSLDPSHKVEVLPVLSLRPKDGIKVIIQSR